MFTDWVSGNADIAVMTGCLYIAGATSTFSFNPALHFGAGPLTFLGQSD